MKKKLFYVFVALVITNIITLALLIVFNIDKETNVLEKEIVATVGKKEITQQQWLSKIETLYGYETLKELVNVEVVKSLAEKNNIEVTEEEVQRQIEVQQTLYDYHDLQLQSDEDLKESIYVDLLFKELVIRDVVVEEEELKEYFNEFSSLYKIPNTYHVSQIVTETQEDANRVIAELSAGSAFDALAMESSIDEFSSRFGGDIGIITENGGLPTELFSEFDHLPLDKWTSVYFIDGQYYIFCLHEKTAGKQYTFNEVKKDIRRDIALAQMGQNFSIESLWEEAEVDWFYGK